MTRRRAILKWLLLAPGALYVGAAAACGKSSDKRNEGESESTKPPTFREQLKHLFLVVGPWTEAERKEASAFYDILLSAKHNEDDIEPLRKDAAHVEELWRQHKDSGMAITEVSASTDEQLRVLGSVVALAYTSGFTYNEARFRAAEIPIPGTCMGPVWAEGTPPSSEDG